MGLYLNLTEIVFVGKSLTGGGGQNPLEPAMLGCAVLSGSKVENFRESLCTVAQEWRRAICPRWRNAGQGRALSACPTRKPGRRWPKVGKRPLRDMRGALKATIRALEPYINPLTVKARLLPRENENAETRAGGQW
jgi:3-deoxy-D-manno-octulosonic-acid transferase